MSLTFYLNDPCPNCSKPILQAVIEPHPDRRDLALQRFQCGECGTIKTNILSLKPPGKSPPGLAA
jgi:hypothetical protein